LPFNLFQPVPASKSQARTIQIQSSKDSDNGRDGPVNRFGIVDKFVEQIAPYHRISIYSSELLKAKQQKETVN
jgi:hypothetical protein